MVPGVENQFRANRYLLVVRVSRKETSDCRWKQDRDIEENSGTCRVSVNEAARYVKDTARQPQR